VSLLVVLVDSAFYQITLDFCHCAVCSGDTDTGVDRRGGGAIESLVSS